MSTGKPLSKLHKLAYIQRLRYPDSSAAALQSINMAAALSFKTDATFFVHDLKIPEKKIREIYSLQAAPLHIQSLHSDRWPKLLYHKRFRYLIYNGLIAIRFCLRREWRNPPGQHNVLFVRSRRELLFWGALRPYLWWMRQWFLICELHDLFLDENIELEAVDTIQVKKFRRALHGFDLVLALTDGLAKDVQDLTQNGVVPVVLPTCTGLPRTQQPPTLKMDSQERIVLGYAGTVDLLHGVNDLFDAIQYLPDRFILRVIGQVHRSAESFIQQWLTESSAAARIELVPPVSYLEISHYLDACDILLAPAGETRHSQRYRSPLKIFDYMARGKPIVAADVPAHKELLQDGVNARLYRAGDPPDLAAVILSIVENPVQQQEIANQAWLQSANYTYEARAEKILNLIEQK